jgi:hypothetical protein
MYRMLRSDRRQSLGEITDQFNRQFVTKISSRAVQSRLNVSSLKITFFQWFLTVHINFDRRNRFLFSRLTGEIVVFLQTGCFLYPSMYKRLRTALEEILVTNWRLNWSVISPKLCHILATQLLKWRVKTREQSVNFSGGDGCEDRKKAYREVEGVEKREFGETRLCTVCLPFFDRRYFDRITRYFFKWRHCERY